MSEQTTAPHPLSLDQIPGAETHYGVRVSSLGEDGMAIIVFSHDCRRAIAAAHRSIRETHGEKATAIWFRCAFWVQVFDHCGCPPHVPPDGWHTDCKCIHDGVPPCSDLFAWSSVQCGPNAVNALPVIEIDWNC